MYFTTAFIPLKHKISFSKRKTENWQQYYIIAYLLSFSLEKKIMSRIRWKTFLSQS
jgi:hypothetical protein